MNLQQLSHEKNKLLFKAARLHSLFPQGDFKNRRCSTPIWMALICNHWLSDLIRRNMVQQEATGDGKEERRF